MATAKSKTTELPLIQIDDEVREMTEDEYKIYLEATTVTKTIAE